MNSTSKRAAASHLEAHLFSGPEADEYQLRLWPLAGVDDLSAVAASFFRTLRDFLLDHGADLDAVVSETVFYADIDRDFSVFSAARAQISSEIVGYCSAVQDLGQPPLNPSSAIELLVHAVIPRKTEASKKQLVVTADASSEETHQAVLLRRAGQKSCYGAGIFGVGEDAREQTLNMFEQAEALLRKAGMAFADVVRTWIYFPEMERDYLDFNEGRRAFFQKYGVDPIPASTGIGALLPGSSQRV
ncbi:MAG: RidA family protein, partial [Pseudomonadota bacterium]